MSEHLYPSATLKTNKQRASLAPEIHDAFQEFSQKVFADGALDKKTKQLIAVAVAHVTQCGYCIRGHTKAAVREGAAPMRSWKPYGLPRRCGRAEPTPIRSWHWTRSTIWRRNPPRIERRVPRI